MNSSLMYRVLARVRLALGRGVALLGFVGMVGVVVSLVLTAAPAPAATAGPTRSAPGVVASTTDRAASSATLSIRALRVQAPVRTVGMHAGAVAVPANVDVVGRWRGSRPWSARTGSSILVAHVADGAGRPGAFASIERLRRGARIVWTVDGQRKVFRVVGKTFTRRTASLPERIWRHDGPRTINLVSCARKRVYASGFYHYTHNVTVTARLVGPR
ncbi:class F sortase [Pimelobacter sp. 30-1]|uniref:class F sortase n=1 Tax=Pimelobacter sp. 30-1 TaxID=2004991 RepID=UPI001C03AD39|nr:class F sortase [Pimelobacter sp. 30-1]MBU2698553.1 hypothetical protein [Pimelobacter sp. 30-1]